MAMSLFYPLCKSLDLSKTKGSPPWVHASTTINSKYLNSKMELLELKKLPLARDCPQLLRRLVNIEPMDPVFVGT
jgi:hypothetical protein